MKWHRLCVFLCFFIFVSKFQRFSMAQVWLYKIWPFHNILFIILLLSELFSLNGEERVIGIIFSFARHKPNTLFQTKFTVVLPFIHYYCFMFFVPVCLYYAYTFLCSIGFSSFVFVCSTQFITCFLVALLHAACIYVYIWLLFFFFLLTLASVSFGILYSRENIYRRMFQWILAFEGVKHIATMRKMPKQSYDTNN